MIKQEKRRLKDLENIVLIQSDFSEVTLPKKLDVIFFNAALHWVHNHAQVFRHFWKMLKSDRTQGSQLLIQCGGYGNLQTVLALLRQVMQQNGFKKNFKNMNQPWHFAKPDDTSKLLGKIGFMINELTKSLTDEKTFQSERTRCNYLAGLKLHMCISFLRGSLWIVGYHIVSKFVYHKVWILLMTLQVFNYFFLTFQTNCRSTNRTIHLAKES